MKLGAFLFWAWLAAGAFGLWWEMHFFLKGKHAHPDLLVRTLKNPTRLIGAVVGCLLLGPFGPLLLAATYWGPGLVLRAKLATVHLLLFFAQRRARYYRWRLEQEFQRSIGRMKGCAHARTMLTDCGMGPTTPKCLDCWALYLGHACSGGLYGGWCANSASPREARRMTEQLAQERGEGT